MKRIYLAGPDVFIANATALGEHKKILCTQYGFIGLFPLDGEIAAQSSARKTGLVISAANEALIHQCNLVIANLTPFRGASADVGTVYELGLARGLGKEIHGYSNDPRPYTQRVFNHSGSGLISEQRAGKLHDKDGLKIEEFELTDNLMIDGGIHASGGELFVSECDRAFDDITVFEALLKRLAQTH